MLNDAAARLTQTRSDTIYTFISAYCRIRPETLTDRLAQVLAIFVMGHRVKSEHVTFLYGAPVMKT